MNKRLHRRVLSAVLLTVALVFCLVPAQKSIVFGQQAGSKADLTPTFWQRDPDAGFPDDGRMHCGPAAISDGLIYLARAYGLKDLVPGTEKKEDQIKLVEELAEAFGTDPKKGGSNMDKIIPGLQSYVKSKGYDFSRLELVIWRSVKDENNKFKIGSKPDISWMRSAVRSKDTVVIFLFSWFDSKTEEDDYGARGGHYVIAVDAASDANEFTIHNPGLTSEKQSENKSVVLKILDEDFVVTRHTGEVNMKGYYEAEGPGLPHNMVAILDGVLVFSLKKHESEAQVNFVGNVPAMLGSFRSDVSKIAVAIPFN